MRRYSSIVLGWLVVALLIGCAAPRPQSPASIQPATDTILSAGDIQVAQEHLQAFGFNPGPVKGVYTAETQAAVRAVQARYGKEVTGLLDLATRRQLLPGLTNSRGRSGGCARVMRRR
jgi:peptidoglycan hydrolase-like protein with peptidoglycan-binding domain